MEREREIKRAIDAGRERGKIEHIDWSLGQKLPEGGQVDCAKVNIKSEDRGTASLGKLKLTKVRTRQ